MSHSRSTLSLTIRPAFACGALLVLATLAMAQHALDANLRVGSGGYNTRRAPQITMARSPYSVSSTGAMYYNRSVAFGSPEVYNSAKYRSGRRPDIFEPKRSGKRESGASALAQSPYSSQRPARRTVAGTTVAGTSARASAGSPGGGIPVIRSRSRPKSSATLQKTGYSPGRRLSSMQAPTLTLQQQPYSASSSASRPIRSRGSK